MRYFDEGRPRRVPEGLTMPFEDHRTMQFVIADEKRQARKKIRQVETEEPA